MKTKRKQREKKERKEKRENKKCSSFFLVFFFASIFEFFKISKLEIHRKHKCVLYYDNIYFFTHFYMILLHSFSHLYDFSMLK